MKCKGCGGDLICRTCAESRCEALTLPYWWRPEPGRCAFRGIFERKGRRVCATHRRKAVVAFIPRSV